MRVAVLVILVLALALYLRGCYPADPWPEKTLVPEVPLQGQVVEQKSWTHKKHKLTALATFKVRGRVLQLKDYSASELGGAVSPRDLALGWGPMSNSHLLKHLKIWMSDRYYNYECSDGTVEDTALMAVNSANMHILPANDGVESTLKSVKIHDIVLIEGLLVRMETPEGPTMTSSLTRDDTGPGACEIIWAEKMERQTPPPKS